MPRPQGRNTWVASPHNAPKMSSISSRGRFFFAFFFNDAEGASVFTLLVESTGFEGVLPVLCDPGVDVIVPCSGREDAAVSRMMVERLTVMFSFSPIRGCCIWWALCCSFACICFAEIVTSFPGCCETVPELMIVEPVPCCCSSEGYQTSSCCRSISVFVTDSAFCAT